MIHWLLIIIALALFQVLGFAFSFPEEYTSISAILLLTAALGLLYRAYQIQRKEKQQKAG